MIKRLLLINVILASIVTLSICFMVDFRNAKLIENNLSDNNYITLSTTSLEDNTAMTMLDIASFLSDKKEHYPLSDQFIERYQQTGGGYIDYARQSGILVDKQSHEPNQKWHFFDSWLIPSINAGTLSWDSDARSRVYIGLKCPELLLWIFEATGVSPEKVRNAMVVAEIGKITKEHVSTTAKKMRDCVPWEDIKINRDIKMATNVTFLPTQLEINSGETKTINASIEPIDTTDVASWSISEGKDCISITTNGNEAVIHAIKPGTAKINVSYNKYVEAELFVTIKKQDVLAIEGLPNVIDLDVSDTLNLNPRLNNETGDFLYESNNNDIATVTNDGVVSGVANGSTTITVTCVQYPNLNKTINVEVFNHGSEENPLSVKQSLELLERISQENGNYTSKMIYVKGRVQDNPSYNGGLTLLDLTESNLGIQVSDSINIEGVDTVAQHDEIVLKGFMRFYNNALQFSKNGDIPVQILRNDRGTSSVSLKEHNNAIVKINELEFTGVKAVKNGEIFSFKVELLNEFIIDKVMVNGSEITELDGVYSFIVHGDSEINIFTVDPLTISQVLTNYNIKYDLGTRKRSVLIDSTAELFEVFELVGEGEGIISSIIQSDLIYGGGYGGRGETAWYEGDMLKFGTTSVNGSMTIVLNAKVIGVKISGYVADKNCKIQLGDSNSTDWTDDINDNKTTIFTCSDMNETTKDIVEGKQTTTVVIYFDSTNTLKIATTNNRPFYITSIEFITEATQNDISIFHSDLNINKNKIKRGTF